MKKQNRREKRKEVENGEQKNENSHEKRTEEQKRINRK